MATKVVGDVAVRVGADVGPLKIGMQDAGRSVDKFGRKAKKSGADLARNLRNVTVVAAAMGAAVMRASSQAISSIDALGKKARQIGITAESLQELQFGATSAGVSIGGLESSLERFVKRLGEAEMGTGAAKKVLDELGISASDLIEMGMDDALGVIADELAKMENASQQAATAAALFGREGVAMVNMLRDGSAGLTTFRDRAREAGAVIDEELVQSAEDLEDQLGTTTLALKRNFQAALIEVGPALITLSELAVNTARGIAAIADAIKQVSDFAAPLIAILKDTEGAAGAPATFSPEDFSGMDKGDQSNTGVFLVDPLTNEIVSSEELLRRQKLQEKVDADARNRLANVRPQSRPDGLGDKEKGGGGINPLIPTEEDLVLMEERFLTQRELLAQQHEADLEQLRKFRESKLGEEERFDALEKDLKEKHLNDLQKLERMKRMAMLSDVAGAFGDLSSLMQSENKKLFKIGQAAALAEAVVKGYQSAVSAWEKGMKIGGPPVAAAFTAASLARTGMLISKIASASPSGGGKQSGGGAAGGGGGGGQGGGAAQTSAPQRQVNLTLIGNEGFSRAQIVQVMNEINEGSDDGTKTVNIRGRR